MAVQISTGTQKPALHHNMHKKLATYCDPSLSAYRLLLLPLFSGGFIEYQDGE